MDLSNETIEDLYFQQIKALTLRTNRRLMTFDRQFSDVY